MNTIETCVIFFIIGWIFFVVGKESDTPYFKKFGAILMPLSFLAFVGVVCFFTFFYN